MSLAQIVDVLDKFPRLKEVILIGAGEPLLHPEWDQIVKLLSDRGLSLQFSTNGTLLTEEKVRKLPPETNVYVSFDTLDSEKYRLLRGGDIKQVYDNLPTIAANVNLVLQPVVTRGFIDEVELYMRLVNGLNAMVSPILPLCYSKTVFDEIYPSPSELRTVTAIIRSKAARWNEMFAEPTLRHCPDPFRNLFVTINGDLYPCCYIYSARPYIEGGAKTFSEYYPDETLDVPAEQYYLGNIFTGEFNSDRLENIKSKINGTGYGDFSMRGKLDLSVENEYCRVCLNRWGCAG